MLYIFVPKQLTS